MEQMSKEEFYELGTEHFIQDRYNEAIEDYRKALAIDPKYMDALLALGECYARQGMLDQAIETAKQALKIDPDEVMAHTSLSRFYQQKGMIAEAEDAGAKAKIASWKAELGKKDF